MSSMPELGDRYRLLDRIGHGGMSVVWRGHDQVLGRIVAVKLLTSGPAGEAARALFRVEARTAAQLSHPHICQVYDYGETETESADHVAYIVMELLSGPTLEQRLRAGGMPLSMALRVCAQVASALAAAHKCGLVHRDIKPANIMMTAVGPKVVDFGIAAIAGAPDEPSSTGEMVGTPAYLAPERWTDGRVESASDVYALGIVLYRMVSGKVPWPASTLTEMLNAHKYQDPEPLPPVDGLPEDLAELCRRCLAKDPGERPTAREVAEGLAAAIGWRMSRGADELIEVGDDAPNPQHEPARTSPPRARRRLALLLAAVVAAVVGATGIFWTADSPVTQYESDAEVGLGRPPAGASATYRPGGETSLTGSANPVGPGHTGDAQPSDPPGSPGTAGRGTASPATGSAKPGPEPEPGQSETPEPDPGTEVVETPGGTVLARCDRSTASVEPLDLAPGYGVVEQTQGPGKVRAGIVLGSSKDEVHVDVRCRAGEPQSTVEVVPTP